jgi:aminopeptidase-like protein
LRYKKNLKIYDFSERGSDERQYCSPNVNLPICGFSRSKFGEYPEYHTSLDNLNLISNKSLKESLQVLALIVDFVELSMFPKLQTFCEPNLSKRNMYPTLSTYNSMSVDLKLRKDLLAYCDGNRSIFEVIDILTKNKKIDLYKIYDELKFLIQKKLIK